MIKKTISFNGIDNCGKTSIINRLSRRYECFIAGDPFKYINVDISKQDMFSIWFEDKNISKLCDLIKFSIEERYNTILKNNFDLCLMDKGCYNFIARIAAALKTRGYSDEMIENLLIECQLKKEYIDIETIKILIVRNDIIDINSLDNSFNIEQNKIYYKYLCEQNSILTKQRNNNLYDFVLINDKIEDITNKIGEIIDKKYGKYNIT